MISVNIDTNSDQDDKLERIRVLMNSQGQAFADVDAMARFAMIQKIKEWEETADIAELKLVRDAFSAATRVQRDAVLAFMGITP